MDGMTDGQCDFNISTTHREPSITKKNPTPFFL